MRTDPILTRAFRLGLDGSPKRKDSRGYYCFGGIWRTPAEATAYLDGWQRKSEDERRWKRSAEREAL